MRKEDRLFTADPLHSERKNFDASKFCQQAISLLSAASYALCLQYSVEVEQEAVSTPGIESWQLANSL